MDAAILREPVTTNRRLLPADLMLVVEVADTTVKRDLGMKRLRYAAAGISEYWVLDSGRLATHVFRNSNLKDYVQIDLVPFGQPLPVPGTDATITLD